MSRAGDVAEALLRVLKYHVEVAGESEHFWGGVADGTIKGKAEIDHKAVLLEDHIAPLMRMCKAEGFRYGDLMEIIPMAFATTHDEREEILADLVDHVRDNYETEVPF